MSSTSLRNTDGECPICFKHEVDIEKKKEKKKKVNKSKKENKDASPDKSNKDSIIILETKDLKV
jgi:hypothetical protein